MLKLKEGVKLIGLKPEALLAINVVASVYERHGADLTITSVTDGKHGRGSFHYLGMAFDCRVRNLSDSQLREILRDIREALTVEFDVVFEKTHIHIEFNPK